MPLVQSSVVENQFAYPSLMSCTSGVPRGGQRVPPEGQVINYSYLNFSPARIIHSVRVVNHCPALSSL